MKIEFNSKTSKIVNNKKSSQEIYWRIKNIQEFKSSEEFNCEMMFLQKAAIYTADLMHDNTRWMKRLIYFRYYILSMNCLVMLMLIWDSQHILPCDARGDEPKDDLASACAGQSGWWSIVDNVNRDGRSQSDMIGKWTSLWHFSEMEIWMKVFFFIRGDAFLLAMLNAEAYCSQDFHTREGLHSAQCVHWKVEIPPGW